MQTQKTYRFAYFVTPHGYGHAARAAAVMGAMQTDYPGTFFEIFTRVPRWFFDISLRGGFNYHEVQSDIGLVQATSMDENLPETIRQLDRSLLFADRQVQHYAEMVQQLGCTAVICDIAPLGISVAQAAGLPSVLVENFTWDWIYEGYLAEEPRFQPHIERMREVFAQATYHIQTEPTCNVQPDADLHAGVVARKPRNPAEVIRRQLGIHTPEPLVLLTMGGILTGLPFLERLQNMPDVLFLVPGGSTRLEKRGSLVSIPHHSEFYHPDLVAACDAVIGKLGYSTLAEVYSTGVPFGFIARQKFRETEVMGAYAQRELNAISLSEERFFLGDWLEAVPQLLQQARRVPQNPHGAQQIASFLNSTFA